jgi:hypothetical protein
MSYFKREAEIMLLIFLVPRLLGLIFALLSPAVFKFHGRDPYKSVGSHKRFVLSAN